MSLDQPQVSLLATEKEKIREFFVCKVKEVDVLSDSLNQVIRDVLSISGLEAKIYMRYLVNNLTDIEYADALETIFSEPPVDEIISKEIIEQYQHQGKRILNIESLPGQYDARVDAVGQCLMLQTGHKDHQIRTSTTIVFDGEVTEEDMQKIKNRLINPVEKEETNVQNTTLLRSVPLPEEIKTLEGFISLTDQDLSDFIVELQLAMNFDDIKMIQAYFKSQGRNPTITEIKVLDTYRSDHCRHTTFTTQIRKVEILGDNPLSSDIKKTFSLLNEQRTNLQRKGNLTLMEVATIQSKHLQSHPSLCPNINNLVVSEEINACTFSTLVEMEDETIEQWEIQFKNETHNHPTEIEPFGGAATCLGGCIRDPLSGRARVFQAMRISGSGDPTEPVSQTLVGKLSQIVISQIAAQGYSSYGNQIGIHTGLVKNFFHPGYKAKHFECGYVIAGAPQSRIKRETPRKGDLIIMLGGRTGRDGIGGAAGASKSHNISSVANLGAEVQKGNPIEERKLTRLFLDPSFTQCVKRCNDFGAGGVSVAVGELTRGVDIDLDVVLTKYDGLDGTELAISESQERMAIVIDSSDLDKVLSLAAHYNLEAIPVATVTNGKIPSEDRLVIRWKGKNIVDLKRSFLDQNGASRYLDTAIIDERSLSMDSSVPLSSSGNFKEAFLTNLSKLGVASQKGIGQIFDSSVGASNVFASYGGKYQCTPQVGMISKIPKFNGVDTQTVAFSTYGSDPSLASQSTYLAGIYAVVESVIRNVILGGNPETIWLSLQEYFGKLGEDAKKRGACLAGLLGAYRAEYELKIPTIGGKDSMSGTFTTKEGARIDVPPTIVSFAANTGDIHHLVSAEFKKSGNDVYYMPLEKDTSGIPDREILRNNLRGLHELIRNDLILSSNIVEQGGVAATIAKMCFGNAIGFELTKSPEPLQHTFFQDILGGVVMEVDSRNSEKIKKHIRGAVRIGETIDERVVKRMGETISLEEAKTAWESPLENVFPTTSGGQIQDPIEVTPKATKTCHIVRIQRGLVTPPKVLVLVFPGTNSELDTRHALIKHGMQPVEVIFRNQNPKDLLESIEELIKQLKESSMVVFPGGFSAGDEPDGSAKFITAVCRMNVVQEALNNFFARSDTLALGICNGFQALIKLGVFDRGSIEQKLTRNSATLTFNAHRRHITDQVGVQVTSVLSPFLSTSKIGDRFVLPVSHGEGRLYMRDSALLETYIHNGQVVLQYLDYDGHPTSSYNGSMRGVAGLCSPDGRIFGLMPHPERTGKNLFQNVPGNHNLDIFGSAAKELGVKR